MSEIHVTTTPVSAPSRYVATDADYQRAIDIAAASHALPETLAALHRAYDAHKQRRSAAAVAHLDEIAAAGVELDRSRFTDLWPTLTDAEYLDLYS